eukprot:snap_masked-scaffold_13-processed-gene-3.33-mRNA-1 protein AED:1.00 eAED:1.00 QI:0/-1/0/0/-1/1/1/0/73
MVHIERYTPFGGYTARWFKAFTLEGKIVAYFHKKQNLAVSTSFLVTFNNAPGILQAYCNTDQDAYCIKSVYST